MGMRPGQAANMTMYRCFRGRCGCGRSPRAVGLQATRTLQGPWHENVEGCGRFSLTSHRQMKLDGGQSMKRITLMLYVPGLVLALALVSWAQVKVLPTETVTIAGTVETIDIARR